MTMLVNLADTTVIKDGNTFCVALRDGRLPVDTDHPLGLYRDDCRHLRGHELRIAASAPRLLIASDTAGTEAVFELTNPDLELDGGETLALQSLRIRVRRRVTGDAMTERITVRSHARTPFAVDLEVRLAADFRSMLEVREIVAPVDRDVHAAADDHTLRFAALGLDGVERWTRITAPGAEAVEDGLLRFPLALDPAEHAELELRYELGGPRPARVRGVVRGAGADADAWLAARPRVSVDDELIDRVLRRCLLDMRLLASELDGRRYYAAGVPWYATLFGRDSIIAALQTLAFDPAMAEQTLELLAARQGTEVNDTRDEEPGKVLHELRGGDVAVAGLSPLARYYGTVDATPLWLCLLSEHANWTGTLARFRALGPRVDAALEWIDRYGDLDGDGLLEYRRRAPGGLDNQGWKDSWDGVVGEDGEPLRPPIALVEAQGYAVRAKRGIARLFAHDGDHARAEQLRSEANRLAAELERFWLGDRGFYAMALDADKRPSRVLASNQGHLLWAEAVDAERAGAIAAALMGEGSYSGWGVRTLSGRERSFNPVGYHGGSIWPHDNALFAVGLRRYGLDQPFLRVFEDLIDVAASFWDYRLPELFAGFSRVDYEDPVPYPVACSPQAWAAGSLPFMLIAGLGLAPDALERRLRIRRPLLPRHVGRLALDGLRVGDATVDLVFERVGDGDSVALIDARVEGDVDVLLELTR